LKSARQKRLNLQQLLSRLLSLKEINPILKALLYLRWNVLWWKSVCWNGRFK